MIINKPKQFILKTTTKYFQYSNFVNFEDINPDRFWFKRVYNNLDQTIYQENIHGVWSKREYDINGNEIYYENSDGYWERYEYDNYGNIIYREDSDGEIIEWSQTKK